MSNVKIWPINFFDQAVLTATPAMSPTLPETFAQLTARDSVARSTTNGDQVITGHWNGQGRKIDGVFLFRMNGFGGKVKVRLLKNGVEVYNSGTQFIVSAVSPIDDGNWGVAPLGVPIDDVLVLEAPHSLILQAPVIATSFELTWTACQQAYWEFGRIFVGLARTAPNNPDYGQLQFGGWKTDMSQSRSRGASVRTRTGDRWRDLQANLYFQNQADRAIWRDVLAQLTNADFVVSLRPGAGGREERDHVADMKLSQHNPFTWADGDEHTTTINFTEV